MRDALRSFRQRYRWASLLIVLLAGATGFFVLFQLFTSDEGPSVTELLARVSPQTLLLASLVYAVVLALAVAGWAWIMYQFSGCQAWLEQARIYCATNVIRRVPGAVWYLFARIAMYEPLGVRRGQVVLTGGVELSLILLSSVVTVGLAWPLTLQQGNFTLVWVFAALAICALLLNPWSLRLFARRLLPPEIQAVPSLPLFLGWITLYVITWIGGAGILFVLVNAIHPLPLSMFPAIVGAWATAGLVSTVLTFVPLGIGQDLTLTAMLALYVAPAEALVIALLMRVVLTLNEIAWSFAALAIRANEAATLLRQVRQLAQPQAPNPEAPADQSLPR